MGHGRAGQAVAWHGRAWHGMVGHDMALQGMQGVAHMAGSYHSYESSSIVNPMFLLFGFYCEHSGKEINYLY